MAYGYYRSVTTDHTQCGSSDSNDFTILVNITNNDFKLVSNGGLIHNTGLSNGQTVCLDVAFYSGIGPIGLLNFEIKYYNGTTGQIIAYVRIPVLSATIDEVIYCYYSDVSVNSFQGNVPNTWPSHFVGIWHLPNGTVLGARDSTLNGNNGIITGALAIAGVNDGAASFAGGTNKISFGPSADFATPSNAHFFFSIWMKSTNVATTFIYGIYDATGPGSDFIFAQLSSPAIQLFLNGQAINFSFNYADGIPHQLVGAYDHLLFKLELYIDGILRDTVNSANANPVSTTPLTLGNDAAGAISPFVGSLEEARLSIGLLLTADRVLQDYNNQKPGSTFITLGPQVAVGPPPPVDIMAYTQSLQLGLETDILQNIVYALPARSCFVQAGAAVEVSNTNGGAFVTLTNANTVGAQTAAQFIRCTTGNTTISVKSL